MDKEKIDNQFKEIADYINKLPKVNRFNVTASKEEAKGMGCVEVCAEANPSMEDIRWINERIGSLRDELYRLWDDLYNHKHNGHIPAINGAKAMNKALKSLGLDEDYEVERKVIYASDGSISGYSFYYPRNAIGV